MYYRYKAKKKDRSFLKTIITFCIIAAGVYFVYSNRTQLMFWKINQNRIVADIDHASAIPDQNKKLRELDRLVESLKLYAKDNPFDPDSYIMSARVNYFIAETELNSSFTEMYINDSFKDVSGAVKKRLINTVRDFNKAKALLNGKALTSSDTIMLGKSFFLNGYYDTEEIFSQISSIKAIPELKLDDIRFYIIISVLSGNYEAALSLAKDLGKVEDTVQGKVFFASLLKDASRYTESIMAFQNILGETSDSNIKMVSHYNLGQIYYRQRLYKESLDQFYSMLAIDDANLNSKIWIGKNYSAIGDRDKARAIWGEVLSMNRSNEEVKKLLSLI